MSSRMVASGSFAAFITILISCFVQAGERCEAAKGITPYCKFKGPEDMVHVPDSPFLIIGQYGGHVRREPGYLVSFDRTTEDIKRLFPIHGKKPPTRLWGQKTCTTPPTYFSPHGVDLIRRPNGDWMLLVVNHGASKKDRDSIQFFKVMPFEQSISLQWQGCVLMEKGIYLNDVAALPQGGFVVPVVEMTGQNKSKSSLLLWKKSKGLSTLMNLNIGYGNGIAITPDGATLFVNDTVFGKVVKISVADKKVVAEAAVKTPDNSSWSNDGELLITSILYSSPEALEACDQNKSGPCDIPFEVTLLDPKSMRTKVLFTHDGSAPFGGATVAVQLEDTLYLGSAFGDRIAAIYFEQDTLEEEKQ